MTAFDHKESVEMRNIEAAAAIMDLPAEFAGLDRDASVRELMLAYFKCGHFLTLNVHDVFEGFLQGDICDACRSEKYFLKNCHYARGSKIGCPSCDLRYTFCNFSHLLGRSALMKDIDFMLRMVSLYESTITAAVRCYTAFREGFHKRSSLCVFVVDEGNAEIYDAHEHLNNEFQATYKTVCMEIGIAESKIEILPRFTCSAYYSRAEIGRFIDHIMDGLNRIRHTIQVSI